MQRGPHHALYIGVFGPNCKGKVVNGRNKRPPPYPATVTPIAIGSSASLVSETKPAGVSTAS